LDESDRDQDMAANPALRSGDGRGHGLAGMPERVALHDRRLDARGAGKQSGKRRAARSAGRAGHRIAPAPART
jgi:hypothetical protein